MSTTVAQMSKEEFRLLLEEIVEQKLLELLGDPDDGLEIRESVKERLLLQKKQVNQGERGLPIEDVIEQLGL